MRQVNIKILQARLSYELKNLPFEITKNGKVIAQCIYNSLETPENESKGIYNDKNTQGPKKSTMRNNNKKATSSTGGRVEYYGAIPFRPYPEPGRKK